MTLYLADKSAQELVRRSPEARQLFRELATSGELATCEIIALEVMYSARNGAHGQTLRTQLASMRWLDTTHAALRRALDVQYDLLQSGKHRVPIPDLIIAATAEQHDAVVLHYDKDFDTIASVTGQPVRWVVPKGSV